MGEKKTVRTRKRFRKAEKTMKQIVYLSSFMM